MTTEQPPVPASVPLPPVVRFLASFAAPDGALPEQIEVTWECEFPPVEALAKLVLVCGQVARARWDALDPRDITGR